MSDIALDTDRDIDVSGLELHIVEDVEGDPAAIAQEIGIGLALWQGEWHLDIGVGMPYLQKIFVKNPRIEYVQGIFRAGIASAPGVLEVTKCIIDFDAETRLLTVDWVARTQDGGVIEQKDAFKL